MVSDPHLFFFPFHLLFPVFSFCICEFVSLVPASSPVLSPNNLFFATGILLDKEAEEDADAEAEEDDKVGSARR